jgi:thiol-disulfide isomerase/thioredoxin
LAKANEKVFQYALVTLVNKYANSKVMGDDAVYVHLVKNYYEAGFASWIDEEQLAKMKERRVALEPLLIGKISPNLSLRDTTINRFYTLHDITTDYTILYIWDPECGHCKKVTPKLGEFYKKHKNESLSVYAITTSNIEEIDVWKNFIKKHNLDWINVSDLYYQTNFRTIYDVTSTPQVFVLDKNKKIIAKRIAVEQLEGFFHQYMKNNGDENYKNFELDNNALHGEDEHHEGDGHEH